MALSRRRAEARRKEFASVWPIDSNGAAEPQAWPGWPRGRFALVLTHDVEGTRGLERVEQLMEVESRLGFRSSFNFVPEREYRLPEALRRKLERAGFETGVHGLKHDGKLYKSEEEFAARAVRIRQYMKQWNACGFRSPLMQHRLDWLHLLGVDYDASTFDTDPFEREPDGAGTIFPFWVAGPDGSGYVELPYTIPQDFTLFTILREPNIDIWKKKLDWVAERGGMALINTHPDYMCFSGKPARDEFPVAFYEDFLKYAREKYAGAYWHALPREVSSYYRAAVPLASRNTRKKVCMLAYTGYETDNRVRRYAEALAKRGDQVEVIALSMEGAPLGTEEISGVTLHRVQCRPDNERQKWTYAYRLLRFLLVSSIFLMRRQKRVRFDLVHVHNVPDFLVFAAWYPKLCGAKLILDIHDIVPELFVSKFKSRTAGLYFKVLAWIERLSTAFVDHVIISNHLWQKTLVSRSVPKSKCSVYVNHVDPALFYRRQRVRDDGKFVVIFPGSFHWHQGLDLAIEAFAHLRAKVPQAEFHLYGGGGGTQPSLTALASKLGLNGSVKFCGVVSLEKVPEVIANADLGVVPKRADTFGNEAYSTKIMEFMSQGVPVVVSKTKIDSYYFDDSVVRFFPSGDVAALADAMVNVAEEQTLRESLIAHGYEYADRNSWDRKKQEYFDLVDSLTTHTFTRRGPRHGGAEN
jgi:glycosyltransferase involved in cell wall biosynthesis/peptidoglycan/xylan/chitin deacetylase (PgdA/CDA1 family)